MSSPSAVSLGAERVTGLGAGGVSAGGFAKESTRALVEVCEDGGGKASEGSAEQALEDDAGRVSETGAAKVPIDGQFVGVTKYAACQRQEVRRPARPRRACAPGGAP